MTVRTRRLGWPLSALLVVLVLAAYRPAWHGACCGMTTGTSRLPIWSRRTACGASGSIWAPRNSTTRSRTRRSGSSNRLWGRETLGYHVVSAMLHALSACLILLILRRLNVPGALLAAGIFAVHPVHVESVAWISELKNTLSGALYLAAALAYLAFDERRRRGVYALASVLFVLAVLAKTVTATLPAACWSCSGGSGPDPKGGRAPARAMARLRHRGGDRDGLDRAHGDGAQGAEFEVGWLERA